MALMGAKFYWLNDSGSQGEVASLGSVSSSSMPEASSSGTGDPYLQLEHHEFDFGLMWQGSRKTIVLEVRNRGPAPVSIGKLDYNCECLHADLEKSRLAPGETSPLSICLEAKGLGHYIYDLKIPSDDPARPIAKITLKAEVRGEFEVKPNRIDFGDVSPDTPMTKTLALTHQGKVPFVLTSVQSSNEDFAVEGAEPFEAGCRYEIRISAKPTPSAANESRLVMGYLTLVTNIQGQKPIRVNLTMKARPRRTP